MSKRLKNIRITHVSYVDKGANQKKFFLCKDATPNVETVVKMLFQKDDPKKLVYGVVYEPDTFDSQGHQASAEEIEKAAHNFLREYRQVDKQHDFKAGAGDVVESYIALTDFSVGEATIKKGSWLMVTKASDEVWEAIQKGDINSYSMAGESDFEDVPESETIQNNVEGGDPEMTPEELKKAIEESLKPLIERVEKLEKAAEETPGTETPAEANPLDVVKSDLTEIKKILTDLVAEFAKSAQKPHSSTPPKDGSAAEESIL